MKNFITYLFSVLFAANVFGQIKIDHVLPYHCKKNLSQKQFDNMLNFKESRGVNNYNIVYNKLELEIDPAVMYVKGAVTANFLPTVANVSSIVFDLVNAIDVDSIIYQNAHINFTHQNDLVSINFPTPLTINQLYSVKIYYQGVPPGGGLGSYVKDTHAGAPIIWTLSEPYGARDWWPCKQSLNDKIDSLDVVVTVPDGNKVGSNGLLVSENLVNGKRTFYWKHRHPIAAYLVAFAATNYVSYIDDVVVQGNHIEVLNYVYPENLASNQQVTAATFIPMQLYDSLFIPYPFANEKYGHAEFGWAGGMEHQTMTFCGAFSYEIIFHELAHQWFGDYVTCGSWKEIWLNEGFATYLTGLCLEHYNNGQYWMQWKAGSIGYIVAETDGSVYVTDTASVGRLFDYRLTYVKAGMLVHMLRWKLGDDSFFAGLRGYLNDPEVGNKYGTTAKLKYHLEAATGNTVSLTEFFNDWLYGEGNPNYVIQWKQNTDKSVELTVQQTQSHQSVSFFEMPLPVKLIGNEKDTIVVLNNTENNQVFSVPVSFDVVSIVFDPEKWIVTREASITGVNDIQNHGKNIVVSPNPVINSLSFTLPEIISVKQISVCSVLGSNVKTIAPQKTNSTYNCNVSDLQSGIYILKVKTAEGELLKKFVKE